MNLRLSSAFGLLLVLLVLVNPKAKARNTAFQDLSTGLLVEEAPTLSGDVEAAADRDRSFGVSSVDTAAISKTHRKLKRRDLTDSLGHNEFSFKLEKRISSSSSTKKLRLLQRAPSEAWRSIRSSDASSTVASISDRNSYHSNSQLVDAMRALNSLYPNMTYLYSVGESVRGVQLAVIAIAGRNPANHVTLRPEMKFVGNMHGNEVVGRELIIRYAKYLLENYERSSRVRHLLDNARIHLMPTMNPDGFSMARLGDCGGVYGRTNSRGHDLNRNFPDYFDLNHIPSRQPEAQSVMDWAKTTQFVLSANMHGGAVVANYPFDNNRGGSYTYSASPDDDVFRALASAYAAHNPPMLASTEFRGGITNGAAWYPLPGGMQDWMYLRAGCMELTLEVSDCKYPAFGFVDKFWRDNRDSMTAMLYRGFIGVKGVVKTEGDAQPIVGARVSVVGRPEVVMNTTSEGEFWRLLMPGKHSLKVEAECCLTKTVEVTVAATGVDDFDASLVEDNPPVEILLNHADPDVRTVSGGKGGAPPIIDLNIQIYSLLAFVCLTREIYGL